MNKNLLNLRFSWRHDDRISGRLIDWPHFVQQQQHIVVVGKRNETKRDVNNHWIYSRLVFLEHFSCNTLVDYSEARCTSIASLNINLLCENSRSTESTPMSPSGAQRVNEPKTTNDKSINTTKKTKRKQNARDRWLWIIYSKATSSVCVRGSKCLFMFGFHIRVSIWFYTILS